MNDSAPDPRIGIPVGVEGRVEPPAVHEPNPEARDAKSVKLGERPRVKLLLVEDDSTIRMVLEMGLRKHHYDCLVAENGKAAQALLKTARPDLIVVDLLMPVMDGLAFLHWLRQTAHDSTPVIVFTTIEDPKITQEVLKCGADFFARKPMHLKELVEAISKLTCPTRRDSRAASA